MSESVAGLWRGVYATLVRTVPGVGIYFSCMHTLKTSLFDGRPTPTQSLFVGGVSRTLAGCLTIPITVVKIRSALVISVPNCNLAHHMVRNAMGLSHGGLRGDSPPP